MTFHKAAMKVLAAYGRTSRSRTGQAFSAVERVSVVDGGRHVGEQGDGGVWLADQLLGQ